MQTSSVNVVCRNSIRVFYHKTSRILVVEKQKRRGSDTILFVAATITFLCAKIVQNDLFHQENEKVLAENDAASQAASVLSMKRFASETICFSIFWPESLPGKRGNTGAEKLCVVTTTCRTEWTGSTSYFTVNR